MDLQCSSLVALSFSLASKGTSTIITAVVVVIASSCTKAVASVDDTTSRFENSGVRMAVGSSADY